MEWIVLIIGIILTLVIVYYNKIKRYQILTQEALSGIDVALKRRYDLIPNLVETVKGYAKHERETLESIILARQGSVQTQYEDSGQTINRILAISENYPELKANANFLHLQRALMDVEEHLQAARRLYNHNTALLKTTIETFPGNLVNGIAKVKSGSYFEITDSERATVKVSLDD